MLSEASLEKGSRNYILHAHKNQATAKRIVAMTMVNDTALKESISIWIVEM